MKFLTALVLSLAVYGTAHANCVVALELNTFSKSNVKAVVENLAQRGCQIGSPKDSNYGIATYLFERIYADTDRGYTDAFGRSHPESNRLYTDYSRVIEIYKGGQLCFRDSKDARLALGAPRSEKKKARESLGSGYDSLIENLNRCF